ncbi:ATP-binding protein [Streptomyces sp. WAC 06725]|uniref:ATP-binding protein n=1 Tax=Streptomyces sp. WAC 06725 TaxID=2203209 RepID=UPI000F73B359|nr:ATP-binding protein [Streptomyces sp. WAC 06725]RSO21602.1 ATP-binding protein [Streptomyces sp. WAC 06725]
MPKTPSGAPTLAPHPSTPLHIFPSTPRAAGQARTYAREVAAKSMPGITGEQLAQVELLVSELVTNACRYGTEPGDLIAVGVTTSATGAQVQVHDPARRRPRHKPPNVNRQRGRGLLIIEAIASNWGVTDRPLGKIVWAELAW